VLVRDSVRKLLAFAGQPLAVESCSLELDSNFGRLGDELSDLLRTVNGFYAFESALHVFPASSTKHTIDLATWNDQALWRDSYRGMADGYLFFAEDVFGGQFAVKDQGVFRFDPETGDAEAMASSIDEWASLILADFEVETGYPLAHEWQARNGAIREGFRLLPKTPFVLGGGYEVENLYALDSAKGMRLRAELAVQIRDLPDGSVIKYSVTD
jgi:hypothetical protein